MKQKLDGHASEASSGKNIIFKKNITQFSVK